MEESRYRSGIDDDRGNGSLIQKRGKRTHNGSKNGARDRGWKCHVSPRLIRGSIQRRIAKCAMSEAADRCGKRDTRLLRPMGEIYGVVVG